MLVHYSLVNCVMFSIIWESLSLRNKLVSLFCFHLMHMKCSEYRVMLQLVDVFIIALQKSLECLRYEIIRQQNSGRTTTEYSTFYKKLKSNQFLLSHIWQLVQDIEDYFSLPILISFLCNGMSITYIMNWVYLKSLARNERDTKMPREYLRPIDQDLLLLFHLSSLYKIPFQIAFAIFHYYALICCGPAG